MKRLVALAVLVGALVIGAPIGTSESAECHVRPVNAHLCQP